MAVKSAIRKGLVAANLITVHDRVVLASEKGNIFKVKGTISDPKFQTSLFFSEHPDFFCIFRENYTVLNYIYNNSLGNNIFLEKETIICCWELIIAGDN